MSHISNGGQRDTNAEISACMERNRSSEYIPIYAEDGDILYFNQQQEYTCGPSQQLSTAQDKCPKCGLVFTY